MTNRVRPYCFRETQRIVTDLGRKFRIRFVKCYIWSIRCANGLFYTAMKRTSFLKVLTETFSLLLSSVRRQLSRFSIFNSAFVFQFYFYTFKNDYNEKTEVFEM